MEPRSVYSVNIIITLAAASDARGDIMHGVENLAKLSLYTMQYLYDAVDDEPSSTYGPGTPRSFQGADKKDLLIVISVLDCCAMLALLGVLIWFRNLVAKEEEQLNAETTTIDDYTAVVHGLPREPLDGAEVVAHLEGAVPACKGCVSQVFVGKNFGEHLERLSARGALLEALDSLDAQAAATKKDLSKPRAKLAEKLAKLDGELSGLHEGKLVAVNAYVTFTTTAALAAALKAYPGGAMRAAFPALQAKEKRFRGKHHLRLAPAPEPSAIIWENVQYTAAARQARQAVSGFLTFCLLLITTGLIIGAKSYESEMPPNVACSAIETDGLLPCERLWNLSATTSNTDPVRIEVDSLGAAQTIRECDDFVSATSGLFTQGWSDWADTTATPATVLPAYLNSPVEQCAAKICQGCYCESAGIMAWAKNEKELYSYCDTYWENYIGNWALKGMSIVAVVVLNGVFTALIPIFAKFEKLPSLGELNTSIAIKTFLSAFFNAYVITLLVYAYIRKLADFPLIFKGPYDDFTPAWYASVGSSLFITTFTQAVQPPLQSALLGWVSKVLLRFRVKSRYTQRDLNNLLAGPEWMLSVRVAQLLTATTLALVLCGTFPGAAFLLCLVFAFSYRADKYILLRVARAPPRYGAEMVTRLCRIMVWAIWLHFGLSAWGFGAQEMPAYHLHLSESTGRMPRTNFGQFNVGDRLEKWQCLVQGIPFLIMSTWLFALRPYGHLLVELIKAQLPKKDGAVEDSAAAISFPDAVAGGKLVGLASYDPRENPQYQTALRSLASAPKGETTEEAAADAAI